MATADVPGFVTKGRFAAATVRGTTWLTEDRCTSTLIRVRVGRVEVDARVDDGDLDRVSGFGSGGVIRVGVESPGFERLREQVKAIAGVLEEDQRMVDELLPTIPEAKAYQDRHPTAAR